MNDIQNRRVMREVATPNRPIRLLAVGDKGLPRRGSEPALPCGRRQLLAEGMDVLARGDHATNQHLRLSSTRLRFRLLAGGFLLVVGNAKTLDFPGDLPYPTEVEQTLGNLRTRVFLADLAGHAQQTSHLVLTPESRLLRPASFFFRRLAVADLQAAAIRFHASHLRNLCLRTRMLLLRQRQLRPNLRLSVALGRRALGRFASWPA